MLEHVLLMFQHGICFSNIDIRVIAFFQLNHTLPKCWTNRKHHFEDISFKAFQPLLPGSYFPCYTDVWFHICDAYSCGD